MQYNKVLLKLIACGLIILNHMLKLILFFRNKSYVIPIYSSQFFITEKVILRRNCILGFLVLIPPHISLSPYPRTGYITNTFI